METMILRGKTRQHASMKKEERGPEGESGETIDLEKEEKERENRKAEGRKKKEGPRKGRNTTPAQRREEKANHN
jgi:hypothetical protein